MRRDERVGEIGDILARLRTEISALREVGGDIPAVGKNAVRMSGTLRALEVQFTDLSMVWRELDGE